MTPSEHHTLSEIAARFRSRSEDARCYRDAYREAAAFSQNASEQVSAHWRAGLREERRAVYEEVADELEAFLRACEVEVEARGG